MKLTQTTKEAVYTFISNVLERRREAEARRREKEIARREKALSEPPKHFSLRAAKRHEPAVSIQTDEDRRHAGYDVHL